DNLDSGKYKVIFEKPAGLTQTGTNTTEDDKDADGGEVDNLKQLKKKSIKNCNS
ncbi:serine-aspartate repeat-containing protein C, partial [Staphylococcus aureus M0424]